MNLLEILINVDSRGSVIVRALASRANNMETVGLSIDMIFIENLHQL